MLKYIGYRVYVHLLLCVIHTISSIYILMAHFCSQPFHRIANYITFTANNTAIDVKQERKLKNI